ncbi:ATP-binding cassette sub-family B member 5 [Candoia aspera]|uniref:ATP-binding cassette sub-family B member 5 n=1 Tax=Candoia aspera TaxID=51853 RepID=UPI002FD867CA
MKDELEIPSNHCDNPAFQLDETTTQKGHLKSKKIEKNETAKKKEKQMVGFFELFSFASVLDIILMIVGSIAAAATGTGQQIIIIIFGQMTNSFVGTSSNVSTGSAEMNNSACPQAASDIENQMATHAYYYVGVGFAVLICSFIQIWTFVTISARQTARIRDKFFFAVLHQEMAWFDTIPIGTLNTRLTEDINTIHKGIGDQFSIIIQHFSTLLTGIIIGFVYGWKLTLVILSISPLIAASGATWSYILSVLTAKELLAYAKAGSVAEEILTAIRTVVAFNGQKKAILRYDANLEEARSIATKRAITTNISMGVSEFFVYGCYALAFWYGTKLTVDEKDNYDIGTVLIVFFSVLIGAFSLGQASPNLESLANARGAAYEVFKIIKKPRPIDSSSTEGFKLDKLRGEIEFKNIHFSYPSRPDIQILKGLNLKIQPGKTIALVGSSGCGKSTTIQLLQRFYDPTQGQITIDGHDIQTLNVKWMRENLGIVSQEPVLFATTIAGNIRYGRDDITDAEIEQAAKEANAYDFISSLPDKFNTMVGERGAQLSGGQKQRIAIARALARNPKILLLDEATSALDNQSESIVQAALDKARTGRTTIVIAHRLSTVRTADVIAGFEKGVLVEQGTHKELMAHKGVYYALVMQQVEPCTGYKTDIYKHFIKGDGDAIKSAIPSPPCHTNLNVEQPEPHKKRVAKYPANFDPRVTAKYDIKALTGQGSFSCVVQVEHKATKQPYAIKLIETKYHEGERTNSERKIWLLGGALAQSNLTKDFIDRLLTVDPSDRMTALQALKRPWVTSQGEEQESDTSKEEAEFQTKDEDGENSEKEDLNERVDLSDLGNPDGGIEVAKRGSFQRISNRCSLHRASTKRSSERKKGKKQTKKAKKDHVEEALQEVPYTRILALNKPEYCYIVVGIIAAAIGGGVVPAFAVLFGKIIGAFQEQDDVKKSQSTVLYSLMFLVLGVISLVTYTIQGFAFGKSGEALTMRLRSLSFKALLQQEIGWFDDHNNGIGVLLTRLSTDASQVKGATGRRLALLTMTVFTLLTALIIAFVHGWQLTLLILACIPLIIIAKAIQVKSTAGHAAKDQKSLEEAGRISTEVVENIRTVVALTREDRFFENYKASLYGPYKDSLKKAPINGFSYAIGQCFNYFINAAVFRVGAWLIAHCFMNYEQLFIVFSSVLFAAMSAGQANSLGPDFSKSKVSAQRIFQLLDRKPLIDNYNEEGEKLEKFEGNIEFKDIHFAYPTRPEVQVLQGLNITISKGQTLALVGSSGCGKSTSIQLLERFYDPISGQVIADGVDTKSLHIQWLRSRLGLVQQEPILFDCSIAENIQYGDNSRVVSQEEIEEAAKAANIHNFIENLPEKYSTRVGDKGAQLSGGQKQRIAIARALVRKPAVLLLDEATSALDTESEKIVQEALDDARKGRTCIVIAHRLSTIQNSDIIAVIQNGRVVEQGTHSQLLALGEFYYALVNAQVSH